MFSIHSTTCKVKGEKLNSFTYQFLYLSSLPYYTKNETVIPNAKANAALHRLSSPNNAYVALTTSSVSTFQVAITVAHNISNVYFEVPRYQVLIPLYPLWDNCKCISLFMDMSIQLMRFMDCLYPYSAYSLNLYITEQLTNIVSPENRTVVPK